MHLPRKLFDILMYFAKPGLSQVLRAAVSQNFLCRHVVDGDILALDQLAQVEVAKCDVLGVRAAGAVPGDVKSSSAVTVKGKELNILPNASPVRKSDR